MMFHLYYKRQIFRPTVFLCIFLTGNVYAMKVSGLIVYVAVFHITTGMSVSGNNKNVRLTDEFKIVLKNTNMRLISFRTKSLQ